MSKIRKKSSSTQRRRKPTSGLVTLAALISSGAAVAQVNETPTYSSEFSAELGLETEYTNNARLSPDDGESERQDTIYAGLHGLWDQAIYKASLDYRIEQRYYADDSQDDDSTADGRAMISIAEDRPFSALFSHSRRRTLDNPSENPLLENTDERDIFYGEVSANLPITSVDTFSLTPNYTKVSYQDASELDSERPGARASLEHRFTPLHSLELMYQWNDVQFEGTNSAFDYEQEIYALGWSANLRQFSYSIYGGQTKNTYDSGRDNDSPYVQIDAAYNNGVHNLTFAASNELTDNSQGNNNRTPDDLFDDEEETTVLRTIDEIELFDMRMTYSYLGVCRSCEVTTNVIYSKDDYQQFDALTSEDISGSIGFFYQATQYSTFGVEAGLRTTEYENDETNNYDEFSTMLTYDYRPHPSWLLRAFTEWDQREFENNSNRDYDEWRTGLAVSYIFSM